MLSLRVLDFAASTSMRTGFPVTADRAAERLTRICAPEYFSWPRYGRSVPAARMSAGAGEESSLPGVDVAALLALAGLRRRDGVQGAGDPAP